MKEQARHLRPAGLIALILGLITLAVYLPALGHGFLAYDDQQYVTENARVLGGLTWQNLGWAFGFHAGNWHPLTWLSHMLDGQVYGLRPAGHHLTNVLLHTANSVLLFLVLKRLTGAVWRSACAAALFAWHPLHVESVAWVAERKDVLSALFFLLTIWAYVRYVESKVQSPKSKVAEGATGVECRVSSENQDSRASPPSSLVPRPSSLAKPSSILHPPSSFFYFSSLLLFALGLMSKPMVVTLPFVLLLLDYWPLQRLESRKQKAESRNVLALVLEKVPFLVLAAVGCVLTVAAQQPAMVSTRGLPIFQRFEHALVAYVHYVGVLSVPRRMAIYYPYDKGVSAATVLLAGVALALVTVLMLRFSSRRPYLVTGWVWFLGMMVPVIGLVQVGDQAWADRYTYLPSVGLFMAVVWALGELGGPITRTTTRTRTILARAAFCALAAGVGVGLLVGTSVQLRYWKDTRTLFEHAARVTRNNPLAATLLGSLLAKEGKLDQAMEYYRTALRYTPGYPEAHFFLGHALDQQGKFDEAIAEYNQALWFKPSQEQTHIFLGSIFAKQKKPSEAAAHYLAALKVNPGSAVAHNNLARVLHTEGRFDEAIAHYSAALKSDPGLAQAHNNLGVLLLQKGRLAEGTAQLREALRLKPGDPESQLNFAQAQAQQEQWSEAADLFARTVTAATSDPNAHCQFATALVHLHRTREAMSHYASALLLQQDFPAALDGLSWILATAADPQVRNGSEAVRMAERACELTGRTDPAKLKTLAAAYAEAGRFPEATATAQTAHDLADQTDRKELAHECQVMIEQFKASKPWR